MSKLVILPLDDRPVNYDYPQLLSAIAGEKVCMPPREWLGNPWRDSEHEKLINWFVKEASDADFVMVAVDTLAYGGLIPSRISPEPYDSVVEKLDLLKELRKINPHLEMYGFSVIQRISRDNTDEEENPYWLHYGAQMFRLSYLEHKSLLNETSAEEESEKGDLRKNIPSEVLDDYLGKRSRNHQVNQKMLAFVAEGILDYLILPQDDTVDFGWNIIEARKLQSRIRKENLTEKAITYPGADETSSLLLARYFCQMENVHPAVFPRFSSGSSMTVITAYEDRPMLELLKAHLAPLGGYVTESAKDADLNLFINAPAIRQGDGSLQWTAQYSKEQLLEMVATNLIPYVEQLTINPVFQATRREMQTPLRNPEEFCCAVLHSLSAGKMVAIADVAFVNGSDLILGNQLMKMPEIAQLASYGGWNTAGNTLGTVLAQAMIYGIAHRKGMNAAQQKAQYDFLFLRFLDDYCYQAIERSLSMVEDLPKFGVQPTFGRIEDDEAAKQIEQRIIERISKQAHNLASVFSMTGQISGVEVNNIYLPWQRLFEIGCAVHTQLAGKQE